MRTFTAALTTAGLIATALTAGLAWVCWQLNQADPDWEAGL